MSFARETESSQKLFACLLVFASSLSKTRSDRVRDGPSERRRAKQKKRDFLASNQIVLSAAVSSSCFQEGREEHMCPWLNSHLLDMTGALRSREGKYVYLYCTIADVINKSLMRYSKKDKKIKITFLLLL